MEQMEGKPFFKKVLVIDDSETDQYIAKRMILKYRFAEEIIARESVPKALDYLRSLVIPPDSTPQLIFLDINMPEMNGFDFLDEYARLPDYVKSNSIIMMLSTSLNPNDHKRAASSPFVNRFLNKPLDKAKMEILEKEFLAKSAISLNQAKYQ